MLFASDARIARVGAPWSSDEIRTEHMARLAEALEPWASWSEAQRRAYAERVVLWTVRHLIADLPGLPDAVRKRCRRASTLGEAAAASWEASWEASWAVEAGAREEAASWAAWAAWAAVEAMAEVAEAMAEVAKAVVEAAAATEDPDATLIRAVNGWIACVFGPVE